MDAEAQVAPKVTALIISHNNAPALRKCLQALENSQNRDRLQILVVDNGSWDESPRLDSEFPQATFMRIPRNFGKTKALNVGVRTAAGELLFFLSPDVEVQPETVSSLATRLEAETAAAAVAPMLRDEKGAPAVRSYPPPAAAHLFAAWRANAEPTAEFLEIREGTAPMVWTTLDAFMVSKYFVKGLNYFDERYGEFLADAELCYQIRRAGKKLLLLGEVTATLHQSEPPPLNDAARALLSADFLSGVTAFAGKHQSFFAGLAYRIRAIITALLAVVSFREFGYRWRRFVAVAGMRKVDGSQREVV